MFHLQIPSIERCRYRKVQSRLQMNFELTQYFNCSTVQLFNCLSVSVPFNTWNLKVKFFVPYYVHTMVCVQHMSGMA